MVTTKHLPTDAKHPDHTWTTKVDRVTVNERAQVVVDALEGLSPEEGVEEAPSGLLAGAGEGGDEQVGGQRSACHAPGAVGHGEQEAALDLERQGAVFSVAPLRLGRRRRHQPLWLACLHRGSNRRGVGVVPARAVLRYERSRAALAEAPQRS